MISNLYLAYETLSFVAENNNRIYSTCNLVALYVVRRVKTLMPFILTFCINGKCSRHENILQS